jgi:uncharacterized protein (DUF305 family)
MWTRVSQVAAALGVTVALAGCGAASSTGGAGSTSSTGGMGMGGMSMGASPSAGQGTALDRAFITGMVPHHQAAIDMARVELQKGTNAQVRALAQAVITDQTKEIADMNALAQTRFGSTPSPMMTGAMGTVMGVPLSMDMSRMGADLAAEAQTDHAFLAMMIPHHASAISMAREELTSGGDGQLKALSAAIIAAQAKEIGVMQQLLSSGV